MLWGDLTWPELKKAAAENYLVIQPCGSIEQHGRHLPVDTDSKIVSEVTLRAAENAGRTLVLPCMSYGLSWHHIEFPGTISFSLETYVAALKDIARSVAHHGFRTLILVNGHGGNSAAVNAVSSAFLDEIDIRIMALGYWDLIDSEAIAKIRSSAIGGMGHSGEFETSIILSLAPDLVHTDRYESNPRAGKMPHVKKDMFASGCVSFPTKFNCISKSGVLGDPTESTREKGKTFLDLSIEALTEQLNQVLKLQDLAEMDKTI